MGDNSLTNVGATHEKADEKANLACDSGSFDCSSCHPQWNERGYRSTGPAVSGRGFPYHPAPDVGVATVRQNHGAAAPQSTTHHERIEACVSRFRSRQVGLVSAPLLIFRRRHPAPLSRMRASPRNVTSIGWP